jgi:hypothetical protein
MSGLADLSDAELMQRYQLSTGSVPPPAPTPEGFTGTRITVGGPDPSKMSDADLQTAYQSHQMGTGEDVIRSIGSGLVKGATSLAGMPGSMINMLSNVAPTPPQTLSSLVTGRPAAPPTEMTGAAKAFNDFFGGSNTYTPGPSRYAGGEDYLKGVESVTGPMHQPQTTAGQYAQTAGEFVPGALLGPGGILGNTIRYGVLPGLASEFAGQKTKGTAFEQPARIGAALVTGGLASLASRPSTAARSIREQMPAGVTEQTVNDAHALITDAAQRGVTLSWPEALSQVAQRPVLSDMARHLEASGPTTGRMADFYAQRPQQLEVAGRGAIDTLGPATANPSMIGPQAGAAATQVLDRVRGAINAATRPSYDAARQSLVPQSVHAAMRNDPLFVQALDAVRNDPARNSFVRGLSDRSTVVYDAVKQELAERAANLANPVQPGHSNTAAAATGSLGGDVRNIAVAADRNAMGLTPGQGVGNLEHALAEQARLRQQYLEPLQRGPLGRIADKDITTQKAMDALFPKNPLPNSAQEIGTTVQALVNRNPIVAGQLVRAHAESTFNEALRDLQTGANQMGAAKFAVRLTGNPQQRANFEAAVTALPNGADRLAGFNRFLDIAEATGTRQNIGSKTAYNAEFLKGQSASGTIGEAAKAISKPVQALKFLADRYERWQLGHNLDQLADILTNPAAVNQFRAIARMPPGSQQAAVIAARIAMLSRSGAASGEPVGQSRH